MSIDTALFKYNGRDEEISVSEIERHNNFDLVKQNLFCSYLGCSAKIEYVPQGKNKPHFKTWPRQDHSKDCVDYFERIEKLKGEKNSASIDVTLNDKHISRVLKELYKEANESAEEKKKRLEAKKNKKKKNKIVDNNNKEKQETIRTNATTGDGENNSDGAYRAPNVRKKHNIHLLNEDDLGYTRGVYGEIERITISQGKVTLHLFHKQKKCNVHFEESFFSTSAFNIISMFKNVEDCLSKNLKIEFTGVGRIVKRNNQIDLLINDQNHFKLNDMRIAVFSHLYLSDIG